MAEAGPRLQRVLRPQGVGRSRRASGRAGGARRGACVLGVRYAGLCGLRGRALKEGWLQEPEAAGHQPHGYWGRAGHSVPDRADGRRSLVGPRAYEVAAHPLSRISPYIIVMSVITVTVARKPLRQGVSL